MAEQLIDSLTGDFDPGEVPRRVPRGAAALIERKAEGKEIVEPAAEEPKATKAPDLMAALEESIAAVRRPATALASASGRQQATATSRPRSRPGAERAQGRQEVLAPEAWPARPPGRGRRAELKLTNLDKVLYPEAGFTKGEMIDYYARVATAILPHLRGRPMTLRASRTASRTKPFFEKRCPEHRPDWVKTAPVEAAHDGRSTSASATTCRRWSGWRSWRRSSCTPRSRCRGHRAADRAGLRPRPRPAGRRSSTAAGVGAAAARAVRRPRARVLPEDLGLQGPPGLRPAEHEDHLRARPSRSPSASPSCSRSRHPDLVVSKMKKDRARARSSSTGARTTEHKTTSAVYSLRARERPTVSTPVTGTRSRAALEAEDADSCASRRATC